MAKGMSTPMKKALVEAASKGEGIETLAGVVEKFIRLSGGANGIAKMLHTEYHAAKEGSLLRQRVLDMILKTWKYVDESQGQLDDLGSLDDEDLERILKDRLQGLGPTDAEENPRPAGPKLEEGAQRPPGNPGIAPAASADPAPDA